MRLAVLSDIHANLAALEAVCDDLPPVDELWALGDIVGYGPQPNEVIRRLQELGVRAVTGNHDGAAIGRVDASWFNPDANAAIQWTATVLDENARAYLAALPEVRRDGELTAVHGSPREPIWEYITDASIAAANLSAFETRHCLYGHTHLPVIYRADGAHMTVIPATPAAPPLAPGRDHGPARIRGGGIEELDLHADDRAEAGLLGCRCESDDAVEALVVRDREARQAELDRPLDEVLDRRGPVEEREVGVAVELGEGWLDHDRPASGAVWGTADDRTNVLSSKASPGRNIRARRGVIRAVGRNVRSLVAVLARIVALVTIASLLILVLLPAALAVQAAHGV